MKRATGMGLLALLGAVTTSGAVLAQTFPSKPVRIVVGFTPGSSVDIGARTVGVPLQEVLGQPIIVENRAGANGLLAAHNVANSPADGYTLFFGNATNVHPVFVKDNPLDASKQFSPVSNVLATPYVFYISGKKPFKTLQELVAYSKANPGKVNYGSTATSIELLALVLKSRVSMGNYVVVNYKGAPELIQALTNGEMDFAIAQPPAFVSSVQSGAIRALFTTQETTVYPNVPTAADAGIKDYAPASNSGIWAPLNTPAPVRQVLTAAAAKAAKNPALVEQVRTSSGGRTVGSSQEEQLKGFEADVRFWQEAARLGNFQPQ